MSCCKKESDIKDDVKDYYGKKLQSMNDLTTPACKTPSQPIPAHIREALTLIHDEVAAKYYGCGIVVPGCLDGMNILDLGSGSGRDCFALSKLVGPRGFVTGIDMTDEQLEVANKYIDYHKEKFGFEKPNVKFVKGYIEELTAAGVEENSVDIIVSNCVINLCKDKTRALKEAFKVLKDGGELYFSDVYTDRELSEDIRNHKELWGECVAGALDWKVLGQIAKDVGFEVPRILTGTSITIDKPELKQVVGDARFVSVLYRLFKLPPDVKKESASVTYNGSSAGFADAFKFDHSLTFETGKPVNVDGSTAAILRTSRFKNCFTFEKVPCCQQISPVTMKSPFEIIDQNGVKSSTCCGSKCC